MKIILKIFFFTFSKISIGFTKAIVNLKIYMFIEVFIITKKMEIINKKKLIIVIFNANNKTFIIYISNFRRKKQFCLFICLIL